MSGQGTSEQGRRSPARSLLTPPNLLSMLRLAGVPVFLWAILTGQDLLAFVLLALSGITDYLDGKIARAFHMESRLGELLELQGSILPSQYD